MKKSKLISAIIATILISGSTLSVFASDSENNRQESGRNENQQEDNSYSNRTTSVTSSSIPRQIEPINTTSVNINSGASVDSTTQTGMTERTNSTSVNFETSSNSTQSSTGTVSAPITSTTQTGQIDSSVAQPMAQYVYQSIVDKYLALIDEKLGNKTVDQEVKVLNTIANKLQVMADKLPDSSKKDLILELQDATFTKIDDLQSNIMATDAILSDLLISPTSGTPSISSTGSVGTGTTTP